MGRRRGHSAAALVALLTSSAVLVTAQSGSGSNNSDSSGSNGSSSNGSAAPVFLNVSHADDDAWTCATYDDDGAYTPARCGGQDSTMCDWAFGIDWKVGAFCGAACDAGAGAICLMEVLNDLDRSCSTLQGWCVPSPRTLKNEKRCLLISGKCCVPPPDVSGNATLPNRAAGA